MSYVLKGNNRNKKFPTPLRIVAAVIVIVGLLYIIFPNALPSFFTTLVRPFWGIQGNIQYGDSFISAADLIKENTDLKNTIAENQARDLESSLLQRENDELKGLLGRGTSAHFVLGQILKKPPFSVYDSFILDIGLSSNIKVGDKVYASGIIPIGEIAEVTGSTSKVKLYSSPGETYTVLIGANNVPATAQGNGGGTFQASIPGDVGIAIGDDVIIPSLTNAFVGKVQDVISDPSHPFATILFDQPINLYQLRWVDVDTTNN